VNLDLLLSDFTEKALVTALVNKYGGKWVTFRQQHCATLSHHIIPKHHVATGIESAVEPKLELQGCDAKDIYGECVSFATQHTNAATIPQNRLELLHKHVYLHSYVDEGSTCFVSHPGIAGNKCSHIKLKGACVEDFSDLVVVSGGDEVDLSKKGTYFVKYSCHVPGFPGITQSRSVVVKASVEASGKSNTPQLGKYSKSHPWIKSPRPPRRLTRQRRLRRA
jgi:hypothetical protein